MRLVRAQPISSRYASPEEMFDRRRALLRRSTDAPRVLWPHQTKMLKAFMDNKDRPDLALELPTGTGKTLTGLLITEWNRQHQDERAVYACPTRQLARQVHEAAYRQGIDTVLLTGSSKDWDPADRRAYETAGKVAVTTYSSIFNSSPKIVEAGTLLFDDAHAAHQYVSQAYSISIDRSDEHYFTVLEAVSSALDNMFIQRLRGDETDPGIRKDVRLVVPLRQEGMPERLSSALAGLSGGLRHRYAMIGTGIASCLVYVGYDSILVRPYIPPTSQSTVFTSARQRLYLSATLGEGGELERSFGRYGITRLPGPGLDGLPSWGRRLFVFPDLVNGCDPEKLSRDIVTRAGKALVLAPRMTIAEGTARALAPDGWDVLTRDDIQDSITRFKELDHCLCALASRYDGIDLPSSTCRLIVMDGVPNQDNLQERFLQSSARAGAALASRVRTRVVQGAGRCTRAPDDTAVVLVRNELATYLLGPDVLRTLDPELQAEIRFGWAQSDSLTYEEVLDLVNTFLSQDTDEAWRDEVEKEVLPGYLRQSQDELTSPPAQKHLATCARAEVRAWNAASASSWQEAAEHAHEVVEALSPGGSATRGYKALWTYLEACWTDQHAQDTTDQTAHADAARLVRQARSTAGDGTWAYQMAPFTNTNQAPHLSTLDNTAVRKLTDLLRSSLKSQGATSSARQKISTMVDSLSDKGTSTNRYEEALRHLGHLLGADSERWDKSSDSSRHGRCDVAWCWDNELWVTLEAKNQQHDTNAIGLDEVRQANPHLDLLAKDLNACPAQGVSVVISPKPVVVPDGEAAASPDLYLVDLDTITTLAHDTSHAWTCLLRSEAALDDEQALRDSVTRTLTSCNLLPSAVKNRITTRSVARTHG